LNKRLIFDTVPVSETLQQLSCQSYNNSKDFYARAMTKQDLPKRYHYINNRRIEDIVFDIADEYVIVKYVVVVASNVVVETRSWHWLLNHGLGLGLEGSGFVFGLGLESCTDNF